MGRSRWGMAGWLATGLGAVLGVSAALGHAELGSAVALGLVLTAVPSLPTTARPALATIAVRGLIVLVGASLAVLAAGDPLVLGMAVVAAAVCGGLFETVGPTAGLAVVLVAVDVQRTGHGDVSVVAGLWPYAVGALVVGVVWAAWFVCAEGARVVRHRPPQRSVAPGSRPWRTRRGHAARVGIAVAAAVVVAGFLPADLVGAHWLITSVLLTVQPAAADTGMRLAQRLSGNAVGALIAALLLGTHPSVPVIAVVTVVLFTLAMALRPVNYTWWAVTGPPVLLVISEYPQLFPWYEGGVRLGMNLLGAAIVLVVVFGLPMMSRIGKRWRAADFPDSRESDSVSKMESRKMMP